MLFHVSRHLFMIQLGISVLATCRPHVTTYSKFWSLPRHDTLTLRPSQCGNRSKLLKPFQRMFSVGFAKGKLLLGPKRIQWKTNPVTFFATFASEKSDFLVFLWNFERFVRKWASISASPSLPPSSGCSKFVKVPFSPGYEPTGFLL